MNNCISEFSARLPRISPPLLDLSDNREISYKVTPRIDGDEGMFYHSEKVMENIRNLFQMCRFVPTDRCDRNAINNHMALVVKFFEQFYDNFLRIRPQLTHYEEIYSYYKLHLDNNTSFIECNDEYYEGGYPSDNEVNDTIAYFTGRILDREWEGDRTVQKCEFLYFTGVEPDIGIGSFGEPISYTNSNIHALSFKTTHGISLINDCTAVPPVITQEAFEDWASAFEHDKELNEIAQAWELSSSSFCRVVLDIVYSVWNKPRKVVDYLSKMPSSLFRLQDPRIRRDPKEYMNYIHGRLYP